jgi:hypothetical protein
VSEQQLTHLTLLDVSDRELLLLVRDHANSGGFVFAGQIATVLDIGGERPGRTVASRFSWLKRLGALERASKTDAYGTDEESQQLGWRLTDLGLAIATGKLKKATEQTLDGMDPGALILLTRWLGGRVSQNGVGRFVDREYRFGRGGRR